MTASECAKFYGEACDKAEALKVILKDFGDCYWKLVKARKITSVAGANALADELKTKWRTFLHLCPPQKINTGLLLFIDPEALSEILKTVMPTVKI
jgi:hypothetical protein